MLTSQQKNQFRRQVLSWYRKNQHDLPWRKTRDPYKILVSEVMLQQTQVERVKEKWPEFLKQFSTLKSLSLSPTAKVIQAWKGMGYNRRALYLQKTAQSVMEKYGGKFPQTLKELRTLPGVGEYTARALLVFAFEKSYIAPDVNVVRILYRSFPSPLHKGHRLRRGPAYLKIKVVGGEEVGRGWVRRLIAIGDAIVTPKTAYDLNQALMDLGRTVCTAKNPKADLCPLHHRHESVVSKRLQKKEPMFAGVPRRIWRGRIVELIRRKKRFHQDSVFAMLGIQQDSQSKQWLQSVLRQLTSDGLLVRHRETVTFP